MKKTYSLRVLILMFFVLTHIEIMAQINSTPAVVPFNSNPNYGTNGMMPTNLPTSGTFGKSTDAANAYNAWKSEFREVCSGKGARIKFDNTSETVSEGIGYGMLLAAYAADKTFFDELYTYWKAYLSPNGLMNWKINGCGGVIGTGSATDADFDAAYALLVAANQWPSATTPHNYTNEFNTMIARIRQFDMANNGRATNGDSWFQNDCTNPGYHSPGYYQAFASKNTTNATYWSNTAYNFAYDVLWAANAHSTTGLVSNWSNSTGTPNQCNSAGNGQIEPIGFGYDASRYPWRIAQDVLWYNSTKGRVLANKITEYMKGRGATNIGGPLNLNGTNGSGYQRNATFISMLTLAVMAADNNTTNQNFLNSMYTQTVNSINGDAYFGKTLRVISLFMLTGNFWKIGTTSNQEINVRATGVKVGTGSTTATNLQVDHNSTFDFQNTQTTAGNPEGKTITFTIENLGFQNLNLTGNPNRVTVSGPDAAMFTIVQPSLSTLSLNQTTTFTVQFRPTSTGVKTAALSIASNDADENPYIINLTGLGTLNQANSNLQITLYNDTPIACGGTLAFGNATTGAFATRVLKIKNTGDGALNLTSYTYSSARFSTVGTAPTTVPVGGTALLTVQFNPNAASSFSGTLTIANNDPVKPSCVINLTGTGVACTSSGDILQDFDNNNNLVQRTGSVNTTFTPNEPNPYINNGNSSGHVGKLVIPAGAGAYSKGLVFTPCNTSGQVINYTGRKTLTMLFYSTAPGIPIVVNLKDNTGFSGSYASIAAGNFATTKTNEWEKIVMDFGTASGAVWNPLTDAEANTTSFIEMFINNTSANGATPLTYFFDEIRFEPNPCIAGIPATKILNDFDNNQYVSLAYTNTTSNFAIVANPSKTGINLSNNVGRHNRTATGTDYDNGLRWSGCNGKIDLTINDGIVSFMIYSPVAGVPIIANIMKPDGPDANTDPDEAGSAQAVATLPNTWHKVYFDFSAYKNATDIISIDILIDPLRTKGAQTYYIDNIQYDVMPNCVADIAASNVLMDFDQNRNITKVYPGTPVFDDVAANPSTTGNSSALTGKLVRAATGQYASSIRYSACGDNFLIQSGKNKFELMVYSPQVGVAVELDFKTSAEVSIKSVSKLTTKANQWETLVFDFSDITNTTTATLLDIFIDPTAQFVSTVASRTYFIDNLKYSTEAGPEIAVFAGDALKLTGSSHSFGTVAAGSSSADVAFSIRNYGSALLTLSTPPSDLVISGPNAADFVVTKNPTYVTNVSANSATNFFIKFSPTTGGTKTATLTIANNDGDENPYIITLSGTSTCPTLSTTPAVSGPANPCTGTTQTYSITTVTNASNYAWTVPSGMTITDGNGTTSITVSIGGSGGDIMVTPSNHCSTGTPAVRSVSVNSVPAIPGAISGPSPVCANKTGLVYSITPLANVTGYVWTVPSGAVITNGSTTNSITVTWGTTAGNITVRGTNACGNGPTNQRSISLTTVSCNPPTEKTISGPTTVTAGSTHTYSVSAPETGSTYSWTLPSGATIVSESSDKSSITVTFGTTGGTLTLTETNGAGSTNNTLTITVNPVTGVSGALANAILIAPNPGNGIYNVSFNRSIAGEVSVTVRNLFGETVYSNSNADNSFAVDIQNLANGVYFLEIQTSEGTAVKRIVKE
ncbi:MAG: glycosyl hydrolase family 8 [Cytophagaceae bacterium]